LGYLRSKGGLSGLLRAALPALALGLLCLLASTRTEARPNNAMSAPRVFVETGVNGVSAALKMPAQHVALLRPIPPAKTPRQQVSCRSHPPTNCTLKPTPPAKTPPPTKPIRKVKTPRSTKPIRQAKQPASPDIPLWEKCRLLMPEEPGSETLMLACKKAKYPTPHWPHCRGGVVGGECTDEPTQSGPPPESPSVGDRVRQDVHDFIQSEYDKKHGKTPPPPCANSGNLQQDVTDILQGCQ
jgi:hypothetical protein